MTNDLKNLFSEFKQYLRLEKRFVLLSVAEKGTVIISLLIIVAVLLVLFSIAIAFMLMGLAHYIGFAIHSLALGYAAVALIALLLMVCFYALRVRLVINPLAAFMRHLFASTTQQMPK